MGLEGQGVGSLGMPGGKGRVYGSFPGGPSALCKPCGSGFLFPRFNQGGSSGGGDPGSSGEGCCRARTSQSRVLLSDVCCPQSHRRVETHYRFVSFEQIYSEDEVQDGDCPVGPSLGSKERLDGLHRPEGCVPSNPHSSSQSEVPSFCVSGEPLAIQGSPIRYHNGSPSFHQGYGSGVCHCSPVRNSFTPLPRRLANLGLVSRGGDLGEGSDPRDLCGSRDSSKSREVNSHSFSSSDLPGCSDRLRGFEGFSCASADRTFLLNSGRISVLRGAARKVLEDPSRSPSVPDCVGSRRSPQNEVSTVSSEVQLGLPGRDRSGGLGHPLSGGSSVVVRPRSSGEGNLDVDSLTRPNVLVGRVRSELGRQPVGRVCLGCLVGRGGSSLHQCARALGGREGSPRLSASSAGLSRGGVLRQHHGCVVSEASGGSAVSSAQLGCSEDPPLGGGAADNLDASICHRESERCGRCSVSPKSDFGFGMVSPSGGLRRDFKEVASDGGPLRHLTKSEALCLFCSNVGSHGCGHRCYAPAMGQSSGLRVSTLCVSEAGPQQVEVQLEHRDDPNCSVLVTEGMVSQSSRPPGGDSG